MNETKLPAGWTLGFERDGRELVVVMVKATYVIPRDGGEPVFAEEHAALTEEDQFVGEPGMSAPLHETDYAHRKPACDVLLNATAYVPGGRKERQIRVGMQVGRVAKSFAVIGNRVWKKGVLGVAPSAPEPFSAMAISYGNAFGGVDRSKREPENVKTFLDNPVGCGYSHFKEEIDGKPLPNTEALNQRVEDPNGGYRPMAFGPIGRNWRSRVQFAGTYDQKWMASRAPFWPDDFDYRYFQAAPSDQQIPHPVGGEEVLLQNLTPNGQVAFRLPMIPMPVLFIPHLGEDREVRAVVDTIVVEPDLERFTMTWRASLPMTRSCFDIREVVVGEMPRAWHQARRAGDKPYYKSLSELVRARAGSR